MPSQYQIEKAAGIDETVAKYMMSRCSPAARSAMGLLRMLVDFFEPAGFELLKAAVADCRKEIAEMEGVKETKSGHT